jgi:hypothetical protein
LTSRAADAGKPKYLHGFEEFFCAQTGVIDIGPVLYSRHIFFWACVFGNWILFVICDLIFAGLAGLRTPMFVNDPANQTN